MSDRELLYLDMAYCTLCDRYFPGTDARRHHVQVSSNHPLCNTCNRRFANKNSLRNHLVVSPRHNWCAVCERDFRTPAGLRIHIEYAAVHRDDSDDDSDDDDDDPLDVDDSVEGWEDELGQRQYPDEPQPQDSDDAESVDYWTDDDQTEFEDDQDDYDGFARVPPSSDSSGEHNNASSSSRSSETHTDTTPAEPTTSPAAAILISCPLCLEAPNQPSVTKCGHLFCTSCIKTALSKKKMCPVCRDFVTSKDLRRIYLPGCLLPSSSPSPSPSASPDPSSPSPSSSS